MIALYIIGAMFIIMSILLNIKARQEIKINPDCKKKWNVINCLMAIALIIIIGIMIIKLF